MNAFWRRRDDQPVLPSTRACGNRAGGAPDCGAPPVCYRTSDYHLRQDRLVIASAPKGIHALSDVPREIDEQKIADALAQLYTDATRGYFKDIKRVSPACLVIADGSKVETSNITRSRITFGDVRYASDDDYVEAGRSLFETSVKATLPAARARRRIHERRAHFIDGGRNGRAASFRAG